MAPFFISVFVLFVATLAAVFGFKYLFFRKRDQSTSEVEEMDEFDKAAFAKNADVDVMRFQGYYRIVGFAVTILFSIILVEYSLKIIFPVDLTAGPVEENITSEIEIPKSEPPKPKPKPKSKPKTLEQVDDKQLVDTTAQQPDTMQFVRGAPIEIDDEDDDEEEELPPPPPPPTKNPQVKAQFPGGQGALMGWVYNKLKEVFPEEDTKNGTRGMVVVEFIVGVDGYVKDVEIKRGASPTLDAAIKDMLGTCPRWTPATHFGTKVPQITGIPIRITPH